MRSPYPAPFDRPFYIIMNLAVGGNFGGNPDGNTVFPGEMQVDYVRVYDLPRVALQSGSLHEAPQLTAKTDSDGCSLVRQAFD